MKKRLINVFNFTVYNVMRELFFIILSQISIALVLAVVALASAAPQQPNQPPIPILKYENDGVNFDGSYKWR